MISKEKKPNRNIGIWKNIALLGIIILSIPGFSQDQITNLEKYWKYRAKLLDDFMIEDSNVLKLGVNIPVNAIKVNDGTVLGDGNAYVKVAKAGDGNNVRGIYLSLLATELWLLKNNEQDYSETLKELLYFMLAMERLDAYSESYIRAAEEYDMYYDWDRSNWDPTTSQYVDGDINGFQLRNDFDEEFWTENSTSFPNADHLRSCMYNVPPLGRILNQNSTDNIGHIMVGLALLKSLVGSEDVTGIPVTYQYQHIPNYLSDKGIMNGSTVNFGLWAEDFTRRYIDYIQNENSRFFWSGLLLEVVHGLFSSGITTNWYCWDPVRDDYVFQGSGNDGSLPVFLNYGFLSAGFNITNDNNLWEPNSPDHETGDFYEANFVNPIISGNLNSQMRILGALGDQKLSNTLDILKNHRETQNEEGSDDTYRPAPFEHLPLIYTILFRDRYEREHFYVVGSSEYYDEIDIYDSLLNIADECGVCSYLQPEWSAPSRLIWPENLTTSSNVDQRYNGLDYMLLHNLRYIAFLWPEFDDVIAEPSYGYEYVTLKGGDIYSASNIYNANVEFKASRRIVLEPGFKVEGGQFLAQIEPIQVGYEPTEYVKLNVAECEIQPFSTKKSLIHEFDTESILEIPDTDDIQFSIYPNPVKNKLYLTIPSSPNQKTVDLLIYNGFGQLEYKEELEFTDRGSVNLGDIKSGVYIIVVKSGGNVYKEKLVKL